MVDEDYAYFIAWIGNSVRGASVRTLLGKHWEERMGPAPFLSASLLCIQSPCVEKSDCDSDQKRCLGLNCAPHRANTVAFAQTNREEINKDSSPKTTLSGGGGRERVDCTVDQNDIFLNFVNNKTNTSTKHNTTPVFLPTIFPTRQRSVHKQTNIQTDDSCALVFFSNPLPSEHKTITTKASVK